MPANDFFTKFMGDLFSPNSVEARVIAGNPEAKEIIKKMVPGKTEKGRQQQRILSEAQAVPEIARVYASPPELYRNTAGEAFPLSESPAAGVYSRFNKDARSALPKGTILVDPNTTSVGPAEDTLAHELTHFLHEVRGQEAPVAKYPTEMLIDALAGNAPPPSATDPRRPAFDNLFLKLFNYPYPGR